MKASDAADGELNVASASTYMCIKCTIFQLPSDILGTKRTQPSCWFDLNGKKTNVRLVTSFVVAMIQDVR